MGKSRNDGKAESRSINWRWNKYNGGSRNTMDKSSQGMESDTNERKRIQRIEYIRFLP